MLGEGLLGIHHVTAIAGDPQRNVDFYAGLLGLKLVKITVNYDDPGTYHLYYGDHQGRPGSLLSFFSWPGAEPGRKGTGQATIVSFVVGSNGLRYWGERLEDYKMMYEGPIQRLGERLITFFDHDGLQIELIAQRGAGDRPPARVSAIPAEYAIRRISGVTIAAEETTPTVEVLTGLLGFQLTGQLHNRYRYEVGPAESCSFIDLLHVPGMSSGAGRSAVGNIHHVAWRTPSEEAQRPWHERLAQAGLYPTPVVDRRYFRSIYFREPGGVLFEIATDPPGFGIAEEGPGRQGGLALPPWLESQRPRIEATLPPLRLPQLVGY